MQVLPVPYKSQWDDDAALARKDCGPACVAMILHYYSLPTSTDVVFEATGAGTDEYIGMSQMRNAAAGLGLPMTYFDNKTLDHLRQWLDEGRPVIALVKYSVWSDQGFTQDPFRGPHFVVVVGYDDEGNILINDPDYKGARRAEGDHKAYSADLFDQAWRGFVAEDNNPNGAVLLPDVPPPSVDSLPVFGPATIAYADFARRLEEIGSPLGGHQASLAYMLCQVYGVDPAFPLALFFHASRMGTQGDTLETRNPGLLRYGSDAVDISLSLPGWGRLQRYHAWIDGWRAMLHHLAFYHRARGRTTVAQVLALWDIGAPSASVVPAVEQTMRRYGS